MASDSSDKMDIGVEVDSSYKSVAASWFNVDVDKNIQNNENEDHNETVKKESIRRDLIPTKEKKRKDSKETEKLTPNLSSFLDEKLTKKLMKTKWKAKRKLKDEEANVEERENKTDMEEDSKTVAVEKMLKSSPDTNVPVHTIESLRERLAGDTLSQSCRKRLKKRLNKLIRESGGDIEGGGTPDKAVTSNKVSSKSPDKEQKTEGSLVKRKLTEDTNTQQQEGISPVKRKKNKKRSKQKNIRKDNRPDHMKPPHLRANAAEGETDISNMPKTNSCSSTPNNNSFKQEKEKVLPEKTLPSISPEAKSLKLPKKHKIKGSHFQKEDSVIGKEKIDTGVAVKHKFQEKETPVPSGNDLKHKLSEDKKKRLKKRLKKLAQMRSVDVSEEEDEVHQLSPKKFKKQNLS